MKLTEEEKVKIQEVVADKLCCFIDEVEDDSKLRNDLGMDSIDAIELIMEFERIFNIQIPDSEAENIEKLSDIYVCIENCN